MENATQALLIAAGVLIGIIILSMAVYLGHTMSEYARITQSQIDENKVVQFNDEFLKYSKLENLTIQDVITVKNYALENNNKFTDYDVNTNRAELNNEYIDVFIDLLALPRKIVLNESDEKLLKDYLGKKFECTVEINPNSGKVYIITFKEIDET